MTEHAADILNESYYAAGRVGQRGSAVHLGDTVCVDGDDREWTVLYLAQNCASLREKGWDRFEPSPGRCPHHRTEPTSRCRVVG